MRRPTELNEVERVTHDHEVFLSFQNDADALQFLHWWHDQGFDIFNEWSEAQ